MLGGNGFDGVFQGQHIIRSPERIGKTKVDLMLPKRAFVVTHFNLQSHLLQGVHQFRPHPNSFIVGGEIKVAAHIVWNRMDGIGSISLEKKKLGFRTDIKNHAARFQPGEGALQYTARVPFKWFAIGRVNVTEQAGAAQLWGGPRKDGIGIHIRSQMHVRFLDARKALHRRTIKPDAILDGTCQPVHRHIHAFNGTGYIGELEGDKLDAILLDPGYNFFIVHFDLRVIKIKKACRACLGLQNKIRLPLPH